MVALRDTRVAISSPHLSGVSTPTAPRKAESRGGTQLTPQRAHSTNKNYRETELMESIGQARRNGRGEMKGGGVREANEGGREGRKRDEGRDRRGTRLKSVESMVACSHRMMVLAPL